MKIRLSGKFIGTKYCWYFRMRRIFSISLHVSGRKHWLLSTFICFAFKLYRFCFYIRIFPVDSDVGWMRVFSIALEPIYFEHHPYIADTTGEGWEGWKYILENGCKQCDKHALHSKCVQIFMCIFSDYGKLLKYSTNAPKINFVQFRCWKRKMNWMCFATL